MRHSRSLPEPEAHWALFLDFDGTLVEIADHPLAVDVHPDLVPVLTRTSAGLDGALAVVSGRSLKQIDHFLAPLRLPGAGLHGLERRLPNGFVLQDDSAHAAVEQARTLLQAFANSHDGVLLEDKGLTLALHYRNAPEHAEDCRTAAESAVAQTDGTLNLLPGKKVFELKPKGSDKGKVVQHLLDLPPFSGRRPVFVGDDVTDEAGFEVVNSLEGISVRVGDGDTTARYHADSVGQVLDWLRRFPVPNH